MSSKSIRVAVVGALIGAACITASTVGQSVAGADPSPPAETFSWYVPYTNSSAQEAWYNLGEEFGEDVATGVFPQAAYVILDFGVPDYDAGYGTDLTTGCDCFSPQLDDLAIAEQFGAGYYKGTQVDYSDDTSWLTIGLGTNNTSTSWFDNATHVKDSGLNWGSIVNNGDTYFGLGGYNDVSMVGAIDSETDSGYAAYSYTSDWYTGFYTNSTFDYADYGDAGGCPTSGGQGNCNETWTTHQVYNMAWGNPIALPVPQIYNSAMGDQWANLASVWTGMSFVGPMSQYLACLDHHNTCGGTDFTADESWDGLYNSLNCSGCPDPQSPPYVTNIRYDLNV
jgi:hypothetical protein